MWFAMYRKNSLDVTSRWISVIKMADINRKAAPNEVIHSICATYSDCATYSILDLILKPFLHLYLRFLAPQIASFRDHLDCILTAP